MKYDGVVILFSTLYSLVIYLLDIELRILLLMTHLSTNKLFIDFTLHLTPAV